MLIATPLPAFSDNYIWLLHKTGNRHVAVVDPGDAGPVLAALDARGVTLEAILITHHHCDHVGGIADLTRRHALPVYGPTHESIPGITHAMIEGDNVRLAGLDVQFSILDVPGHTRGHIAYVGHGMLFCGDTLFMGGCGRLFEGTPGQMHESLKKIASLPANTQVYCAHEYTADNLRFAQVAEPGNTDLAERVGATAALRARGEPSVPAPLALELRTNPFLRCHTKALKTAAERFAGHSLATETEVFATVRYWKDTLD